MPNKYSVALAIALVVAGGISPNLHAVSYADSIVSYTPGTGIPTGYNDSTAALGEPSRVTPGQFGGPVDPFNPAYLNTQVVSISAGGLLTLGVSAPIQNSANNPYGLDFIISGNARFQIVNGDFSGGGVTRFCQKPIPFKFPNRSGTKTKAPVGFIFSCRLLRSSRGNETLIYLFRAESESRYLDCYQQ